MRISTSKKDLNKISERLKLATDEVFTLWDELIALAESMPANQRGGFLHPIRSIESLCDALHAASEQLYYVNINPTISEIKAHSFRLFNPKYTVAEFKAIDDREPFIITRPSKVN